MGAPLSNATAQRIARMFSSHDCELVSALVTELGDDGATESAGTQRIRFAVLKVSGGDLNALQRAIDLAKADWRDVLAAAGFGSDVTAHRWWWPADTPKI